MPEFKKDQTGQWVVKLPEPEKLLKTMPEDFQKRLCFSHYQKWLRDGSVGFDFPDSVIIPIVRVRYRQPVADRLIQSRSVPKQFPAGMADVRLCEARRISRSESLMPSAHGAGVVPVFVPRWRKDKPFSAYDFVAAAKPLLTVRKDQTLKLQHDYSENYPAGDYLVEVLGEHQVTLTKAHIVNTREAKTANDFPATGFKPYWHKLIPALGFAFPKEVSVVEENGKDEQENDDP